MLFLGFCRDLVLEKTFSTSVGAEKAGASSAELLTERLLENDEKLELPIGNARAVRLRGLSFPTRVGSPRRASALRKAICDLFSDL